MSALLNREVQCNVRWQVLRVKTLPRYNAKGGWDTPAGTMENLNSLSGYLYEPVSADEFPRRVYRVKSLLLTVLRGYRAAGRSDGPMFLAVLNFYNALPQVGPLKSLGMHGILGSAKFELKQLLKDDPDTYNNVRRELNAYLKRAQGDQSAMEQFVALFQDVSND